jgi:hypothetical protein
MSHPYSVTSKSFGPLHIIQPQRLACGSHMPGPVFNIIGAVRSQISSISEAILQFSVSRSIYSTQKIEEIESIHDDQSFLHASNTSGFDGEYTAYWFAKWSQ